ncbi:MAG: hypothetical protein GY754_34090, partial [bacterium]|nr:hypothetical protein [bacterium]
MKYYEDPPHSIDYPRVTIYESLVRTRDKYPDSLAYDFFGYTSTYKKFIEEIDRFAHALAARGKLDDSHSMLAILPIFHGAGLAITINGGFMGGAKCILVPQFTPQEV